MQAATADAVERVIVAATAKDVIHPKAIGDSSDKITKVTKVANTHK